MRHGQAAICTAIYKRGEGTTRLSAGIFKMTQIIIEDFRIIIIIALTVILHIILYFLFIQTAVIPVKEDIIYLS